MKPLRILHVVESFGVGGGIENGIGNLIQRLDPDHFEHVLCAVFRMGSQIERYPAGRVRLVCLEQSPKRFSIQAPELARLIREVKPAVVHSRNWGALEAVMAGRWVGSCRLIHSEHGLEATEAMEPRRRQWLRRIAFGLADRVITVSYELRTTLAQRTGFPAHKIGVIHNGVDATRFRPDADARRRFRQEHGIAEEEFCIGSVGRLNQVKDYPTLLRGVEVFNQSCAAWRVLIAGDGPDLAELMELVRSRPALENKVVFLGRCQEVPAFLNAIDVYVQPSIREGISNSVLEAMATGLPAVVTDTGGNPELVIHEESGLLFPVGDFRSLAAGLLALRQARVRERLGRQALQRTREQFSLDGMIGRYEDLYLRIMGDRDAGCAADQRSHAGSPNATLTEKQHG
jgi:sugar transferase (PEP-CTERM/EpsH1 system associated)